MKLFKFLRSTVFMILLFWGWNTVACFLVRWYPDWIFINIFFAAVINVFIGIMITYNGLVGMNKKTMEQVLTSKP